MSRLLAGRSWYLLLALPVILLVALVVTQLRDGPVEVVCSRAADDCVVVRDGEAYEWVVLSRVRRFRDPLMSTTTGLLEAVTADGPVPLLAVNLPRGAYRSSPFPAAPSDTTLATMAAELNRFLVGKDEQWRFGWRPGFEWLRARWFGLFAGTAAMYALLWFGRMWSRVQAAQTVQCRKRCGNGHPVPDHAASCEECGLPVPRP